MGTSAGRRRPADWHPLAEKDPVPGDPEDIRDEVTRMKKLASTLRDQAAILRKAADGDALQGQYADKIREDSGDVEKHFRETAARYERVVGDLGKWANELEGFQERADGVLRAAKRADEEHAAEVKKKEAEAKRDGHSKAPEDPTPTVTWPRTRSSSTRCSPSVTPAPGTTQRTSAGTSPTSSRTADGRTSRTGCTSMRTRSRASLKF